LQDYYAADQNGLTIPEERVSEILLANLAGVEKLSPRLCATAQLDGEQVTLVGILPQSEFHAKELWQTVGLFEKKKHVGCKKASCGAKAVDTSPEALTTQRTIEELKEHDVVIGYDAAQQMNLKAGAKVELLGEKFQVLAVLPAAGTVDDTRVFAHLHTVQ